MFSATVGVNGTMKNNRLGVVTRGGTIDGIATGITPQTAPTMVYDQNGNLTEDGQYVYKYDCLNRQVAVYLPDNSTKVAEYFYDSAGERVGARKFSGGALTGFTQFVRDGAAVVYEKTWSVSGGTNIPQSEKLYVYAGGRMAATKETTLPGTPVTTYTYYAVDHLGTVRYSRTLDPNGTLVAGGAATYKAEPFGVMIPSVTGSPNGNTHFYTGHERDTLPSGFNQDYMHFRYYGSSMGRFMKPDSTFGNAAANPQGFNLYSYVKGNPITFNDPTGHMATRPGGVVTSVGEVQPLWEMLMATGSRALWADKAGNKSGDGGKKDSTAVVVQVVVCGSPDGARNAAAVPQNDETQFFLDEAKKAQITNGKEAIFAILKVPGRGWIGMWKLGEGYNYYSDNPNKFSADMSAMEQTLMTIAGNWGWSLDGHLFDEGHTHPID